MTILLVTLVNNIPIFSGVLPSSKSINSSDILHLSPSSTLLFSSPYPIPFNIPFNSQLEYLFAAIYFLMLYSVCLLYTLSYPCMVPPFFSYKNIEANKPLLCIRNFEKHWHIFSYKPNDKLYCCRDVISVTASHKYLACYILHKMKYCAHCLHFIYWHLLDYEKRALTHPVALAC